MTRHSSSTLVDLTHLQMLPSQPHTGKRKPEDSNPLLNAAAAKRAKKESKLGVSTKRKLNSDDGPSSLLVVRASETQPTRSQPTPTNHANPPPPRFSSQPSLTSYAGPSKPPTKKFKADSQPSNRGRVKSQAKAAIRDRVASSVYDDAAVERDVRAMEDEADHLRRNSRAHTTIDPSVIAEQSVQFQSQRSEGSGTGRSKGKTKVVDISAPLPDNDTPRMERNKQLRQPAMDAIAQSRGRPVEANGGSGQGHRRKSSVSGRGKRISSSFEATGIITQPHNQVSENSFYKHIDCDLPEPERIRQLLIWCSLRAAATPVASSLPPLSAEGVQILKSVQDDVVRMLAEKKIDLSLYSSDAGSSKPPQENLRENEQNVRNRMWEVTYKSHIQGAETEEEAWKRVSYGYDAYSKKLQTSLEKRTASLQPDQQSLSAKAKGKRRATGEEPPDVESQLFPHEHELPPHFHHALALARSVLGYHPQGDDRIAGGGGRRGMTRSGLYREELEGEIKSRLPGLEFKVDQIYTFANAAKATTNIAEKALNERFDVLSANLASRTRPILAPGDSGGTDGSAQLLSTYVAGPSASAPADPLDLMRALSRVDHSRPPAQVGDAARRAAREVQRAEKETGYAPVGEKKLTGMPATPRKMPGTPRRGNTPGRER